MARILIVEDDEALAEEIEHSLRALGYEVVGKATTGKACLDLIQTQAPDPLTTPSLASTQSSPSGVVLVTPLGEVPIEHTASAISDADGARLGTVVVLRDVREQEALREQIAASDRLASLGDARGRSCPRDQQPADLHFGKRLHGQKRAGSLGRNSKLR